ncbi:MAG: rhomboid family intramembrane serine protease [Wenzhouxiangella sp.]|nr:rhomboid family intramembrane serine protease [Wenzhouxiangella sp.]
MLEVPDPEYTSSKRAQANFKLAFVVSSVVVALLWCVYGLNHLLAVDLLRFGLSPRQGWGLLGVLATPLLHASIEHLISNTLPLWVGLTLMLYLFPNASVRALPLIYLGSGVLAWVFARDALHIGASGVVYGILGFLFVSGLLRRDLRSMGVSLMIAFVYGSIIWGLVPINNQMSWELHVAGSVMGVLMAWRLKAWDRPPMKVYDWERFDDEPPSG